MRPSARPREAPIHLLAALFALAGVALGCGSTNGQNTTPVQELEMSVWFDGEGDINTDLASVKAALDDPKTYHVGIVTLMPGLSQVDLIDHGPDFVTIQTNEGIMRRTNITRVVDDTQIVVEFDEVYEAGRAITVTSHFRSTFSATASGVHQQLVISGLSAPGMLGFVYRNFASKSIGNAVMTTNREFLESIASSSP